MRRPGILLTIALAWAGVVAGHLVAYFLTYPSQGIRHAHLLVTGHTWLGLAAASALALLPVVLLAAGMRALRTGEPVSGSALAVRLAAIQVPAFLAIEVLERGWSLERAISDPAVFVGLVVQALVAVAAALLLELFGRAVRAAAERLRPRPRRAPAAFPRPVRSPELASRRHFLPLGRRAPPLTV